MRILWLSSSQLSDKRTFVSGTWVSGLLSILKSYYNDIDITNVIYGNVGKPTEIKTDNVTEWIIPKTKTMNDKTINHIANIINLVKPDVIQVWGTEDIWGMFPLKQLFPSIPAILEIQGILASVSEEYYGGLTPMELIRCWNIKEFLKPSSSLPAIRHLYSKNVDRECEILSNFTNIGVQSEWSAAVVKTFNPNAVLYKSGISLRPPFYESAKWVKPTNGQIRIFSTAIMGQPLKGAYTLFRAFAIIRKIFPNAQLIMAGVNEKGIRRSGFCRMLTKFAKKNGFYDDIIQLGPLSAEQLTEQYRTASVFVNPSNWESYSVVTAEAMYIGCPTVAAYSGAMPELGHDGSILYFPKGDFRICASNIIKILQNDSLARELSEKSIKIGSERQNQENIAKLQMTTYLKLINK